jgi:hypothetical protein
MFATIKRRCVAVLLAAGVLSLARTHAPQAPAERLYGQAEPDRMLAPIALYPVEGDEEVRAAHVSAVATAAGASGSGRRDR